MFVGNGEAVVILPVPANLKALHQQSLRLLQVTSEDKPDAEAIRNIRNRCVIMSFFGYRESSSEGVFCCFILSKSELDFTPSRKGHRIVVPARRVFEVLRSLLGGSLGSFEIS